MGRIFTLNGINQELLLGTNGDDIVQGSRARPSVWNGRRGIIRLLRGDDTIRSSSFVQINGPVDLGGGRDLIAGQGENSPIGQSGVSLVAVDNFNGNVEMGHGRDKIHVERGGLLVGEDSFLDMGDGNDRIDADSMFIGGGSVGTGTGDDRIDLADGTLGSFNGPLSFQSGDDVLIARGGIRVSEAGGVSMGLGNDVIDVRHGGIDNFVFGGAINLGPGNDKIIGFAVIPNSLEPIEPGGVIGGMGKDVIVLQEGVYKISDDRISTVETFLSVAGINYLEGINGGRFAYAPGILTVSEQGTASFMPA